MVLDWPGDPDAGSDSVPLRLAGGLNALVRRGRNQHLARHYPPNPMPEPNQLWTALAAALNDGSDEIRPWLDFAPQTNEVGRSAILFAGLSYLASLRREPMLLFEVGASAGLNLNLDRYGYRYAGEEFGDPSSPLQLAPDWRGPPPPRSDIRILLRQGCDLSPLDAAKHEDRERLLAYVWPDQTERVTRLTRALEIAASHPIKIAKAEAAEWIERTIPQEGLRVLMHSIAFQYFPQDSQRRITRHMETLGASSDAPLAWLHFEFDPDLEKRFLLRLRLWPSGLDRLLAIAGPHGAPIEWLAT